MFDYPQNSHEWAEHKAILQKCPKHNILHDPLVECPECKRKPKAVWASMLVDSPIPDQPNPQDLLNDIWQTFDLSNLHNIYGGCSAYSCQIASTANITKNLGQLNSLGTL